MPDKLTLHVIQLTPPGRGAIATLRIEGPGAADTVQAHVRTPSGRPLTAYPVDRLIVGHFAGDRGEEVVVRRCAGDAVELHCHGGYATVAMIEETLIAAGCQRMTWRDWVATRESDPIAAAALTALADARTERTAAILLDQFHGALRSALDEIRQSIDRGRAALGTGPFFRPRTHLADKRLAENMDLSPSAARQIDLLLERADLGRHLVRPWSVVLAGRVNVGKSSLINALAGYGRSIVHDAPGTTRDAVTAATAIDGWPVELCDTAGLRQGGGAVERAGIERAQERLAQADLAILIFDRSAAWSTEDQAMVDRWPAALLVHNKCDLAAAPDDRPAGLLTSALRGDGVEHLLEAIARRLVPDPPPPGAAVPFTAEQVEMVYRMAGEVGRLRVY